MYLHIDNSKTYTLLCKCKVIKMKFHKEQWEKRDFNRRFPRVKNTIYTTNMCVIY